MDTMDIKIGNRWLNNVENALNGRALDYLVISHMEPDHVGSIKKLLDKHPEVTVVGNAKTFVFYKQFFNSDIDNKLTVKEGDKLELGSHTLTFYMAPMVHWPEVMVSYESSEKILFSADGFGKFGVLDTDEDWDWDCEARRYYFNIVGKYSAQVQSLLKKVAELDISIICPLHGPILKENLGYYIDKYKTWSSYAPEEDGVFIAYASIYGNTADAAYKAAEILKEKGAKNVILADLARDDMAEAVANAFLYNKLVLCSVTYDAALMPAMEKFLWYLKLKNYQNRKVALIENGTWAPTANKLMSAYLEGMKNITICENRVTIKSAMNDETPAALSALADELLS